MDIKIDLKRPLYFDGRRPRPVGIAMHPALFEQLVAQIGVERQEGGLATVRGVPVITLEAMEMSEIKVAMTPMAWTLLLVEKRREKLRKGGE